MAINWTPWFDVPMHRRLEVFFVGFMMGFFIIICPIVFISMIYLLIAGNIFWKFICGSYLLFCLYDIRSCDRGGRGVGSKWVRGWEISKYVMNYFPINLVKTVDLPPERNYLICIFPHGASSIGAAINFGTSHSKWSELFPGIRPRLTSLRANYYMPIGRELILSLGMASASAESLATMLSQSNDPSNKTNCDGYTSNGVGLIVGGVREQRVMYPYVYKLVVAKRRGFIRIALQTGASLVPAFSFGENELYRPANPKCPLLLSGRGFLQYDYGLIPKRHPITTVIGAPIHLERNPNPTQEELDKYHDLFCTRLNELFETHKSKYIENSEEIHLEFE